VEGGTPILSTIASLPAALIKKMLNGSESSGIVDEDAVLIIPGQPVPEVFEDLGRMFLQGRQVIEGVDLPQVAGVDQAHEHIADEDAMLGFVEEGVFPVEDSLFQRPFTKLFVECHDIVDGKMCHHIVDKVL
jgi:hypothetical protein